MRVHQGNPDQRGKVPGSKSLCAELKVGSPIELDLRDVISLNAPRNLSPMTSMKGKEMVELVGEELNTGLY